MDKTTLLTRDIERLENTSFATAFGGPGDENLDGPLGDEAGTLTGCTMFTHYSLLDCLVEEGSGNVCMWVESECSCGCLGCDPPANVPAVEAAAEQAHDDTRWILDIVRGG